MAHPEIGRRILERLITELSDIAIAETMPRQEGNQMHVILSQKAGRKSAPKKAQPDAAEPAATTTTTTTTTTEATTEATTTTTE